jgi:hypothetical protein
MRVWVHRESVTKAKRTRVARITRVTHPAREPRYGDAVAAVVTYLDDELAAIPLAAGVPAAERRVLDLMPSERRRARPRAMHQWCLEQ